jgi:organic radical activating enzyme
MKIRTSQISNYKGIFNKDTFTTMRLALDPNKPITNLKYPEFLDIKITGSCEGNCPYCYMNSVPGGHYPNIISKLHNFFKYTPKDQLPFQVAIGGGEPTLHPEFIPLLKYLREELDILPNYTTNGMYINNNLLKATKEYCGGVAISCHPHLSKYWKIAVELLSAVTKLNLHIIISDKESIDSFVSIYEKYRSTIHYFVLLPYENQGRAESNPKSVDWPYLLKNLPNDKSKLAFGANFYPYLSNTKHNIKISLYEPEIMSKFLDLKDMCLYPSSFYVV